MKANRFAAAFMAVIMAVSFAACSDSENSKAAKTAASESKAQTEASTDKLTYDFDRTLELVEVGGKKYQTYINKPIRFNFEEIPYEEWLAYESPFDEYIELYYDDGSGLFNIEQTTAFALRYAYENDIEYLDLPFEYSDMTIEHGWHYLSLSFPNVPESADENAICKISFPALRCGSKYSLISSGVRSDTYAFPFFISPTAHSYILSK